MTTTAAKLDADFDRRVPGLIHWVCSCDEFASDRPSRFLPWPARGRPVDSVGFLLAHEMLGPLDRTNGRTNQCAHAVVLFSDGELERKIRFKTNVSSGQVHRLASDVAWAFDGLRKIASVPDLEYPQTVTNKLSMLSRQVRWGVPAEALDILRVAQRERVPGVGRQRAVALLEAGIQTFDQLLGSPIQEVSRALGSDRRAEALVKAVASSLGHRGEKFHNLHIQLAETLGLGDSINACNSYLGTDYEASIKSLLEFEKSWAVRAVDKGKRQNVPDLLVSLAARSILIECKTTTKNPALINKEEAFAVLQKGVDFEGSMHQVTIGKPGFDEHSKKKVQGSRDITLVEHEVFIEGMLRLVSQEITATRFFDWLSAPGLAELDRLGGAPSYEILRNQKSAAHSPG